MEFLEQLLNVELGLPARFVIAFVIVLALIGLMAWIVRRVAWGRGGITGGRARQQRLAVVDAAQIDAKRRLLLVRRDNSEHLILIGGSADLVVESQISRSAPAAEQREARAPAQLAAQLQRSQSAREEPPIPPPPSRPVPQPAPAQPAAPQSPAPQSPAPRTVAAQRFPPPPEPSPGDRAASLEPRLNQGAAAPPPRQEPQFPRPAASSPPPEQTVQTPDPKLEDMAQRLESALARPASSPAPSAGEAGQPPREESRPAVDLYEEDRKREG